MPFQLHKRCIAAVLPRSFPEIVKGDGLRSKGFRPKMQAMGYIFRSRSCSLFSQFLFGILWMTQHCPETVRQVGPVASHAKSRPGRSSVVADQSGSGKTLAYLLPLLQRHVLSAPEDATLKLIARGPEGCPAWVMTVGHDTLWL